MLPSTVVTPSATAANMVAAAAAGDGATIATAALRHNSKVTTGERRTSVRVLIHAQFWWSRGASEPRSSCLGAGNHLGFWRSREARLEGEGAGRIHRGAKEWEGALEGKVEEQEGGPTLPPSSSCLLFYFLNHLLQELCIGCLQSRTWSIHRRSPPYQVNLIAEFCLIFILLKTSANFVCLVDYSI